EKYGLKLRIGFMGRSSWLGVHFEPGIAPALGELVDATIEKVGAGQQASHHVVKGMPSRHGWRRSRWWWGWRRNNHAPHQCCENRRAVRRPQACTQVITGPGLVRPVVALDHIIERAGVTVKPAEQGTGRDAPRHAAGDQAGPQRRDGRRTADDLNTAVEVNF